MKKNKYAAMVEHCDKLTQNGAQLSITWNGGGDSGCFDMILDGKSIIHIEKIEEEILELTENHIGYGSFAGDFSACGTVIYNRENKCFQGTDEYSEGMFETHKCVIPICVPTDLWFDRLDIEIEGEVDDFLKVTVQFFIANGPYIEQHGEYENIITKTLNQLICNEINTIDPYTGIWEQRQLSFQDFSRTENNMVYTLTELDYKYNHTEFKDIYFSLTD